MNEALQVKWDLLAYCYGLGLDLGCGDARPHDWFHGIDCKPGTGNLGPNEIMDARDLSRFADKSRDFIFSSHLLNELKDYEKNLKEWWRVLKDDGYLILYLPLEPEAEGNVGCTPKQIIDAMLPLKPWQMVDARTNGDKFFHVYRKCDLPTTLDQPKPEKICAVMKLGAHGDALWASSVLPHLKEQGYHVVMYCQETGEQVLRHDPHIDQLIRFESRVPMDQLGDLFRWMETKYTEARILVECVEGTLLPPPQKVQYHFPKELRHQLSNLNYLDVHHMVAKVPLEPRQKFYPSQAEMRWANELRATMQQFLVVVVPNGSSVSKMWPYTGTLVKRLLAEREDVSVVQIGDGRGQTFEAHPRLLVVQHYWDVRKAMTFAQLANVVVGQETGMLNSVAFEKHIRKVVLASHSTVDNLTRDWPNTVLLTGQAPCYPCHRLHYDWTYCNKNEMTQAAACQSLITIDAVMEQIQPAIMKEAIAA